MKWKSDNSDKVWSVRLLIEGERASVAHLKCGDETIQSDVTITFDKQSGSIYVNDDGKKLNPKITKVGDSWWVTVSGQTFVVTEALHNSKSTTEDQGGLTAPMPGIVRQVNVDTGQKVRKGQPLMVLEAMKMEHQIIAPQAGKIEAIHYNEGDRVEMGSVLISISE